MFKLPATRLDYPDSAKIIFISSDRIEYNIVISFIEVIYFKMDEETELGTIHVPLKKK